VGGRQGGWVGEEKGRGGGSGGETGCGEGEVMGGGGAGRWEKGGCGTVRRRESNNER